MILRTALALALVCAAPLSAQDGVVRGVVRDQDTDRGLPGATVEVLDVQPVRAVAADSTGRYLLGEVPAGRRTIRARQVGYVPLEMEVVVPREQAVEIDIELRMAPIVLAPVEVAAPRRGGAGDTTVAAPGEIAMAGVRVMQSSPGLAEIGLAEVAQQIPGQEPPDPSDVLFVRGTGADLKLVHLDGAPVYAPFPLGGLLEPFSPGLLSSAEVYLGGAPARYDGGLSYILDLRTRAPRGERVRSEGAADGLTARGMIEVPLGESSGILASGRTVHHLGADWMSGGGLPYGYQEGLLRADVDLGSAAALSVTAFGNGEQVWLDSLRAASHAIQWGNAAVAARLHGSLGATRVEVTGALSDFLARLPIARATSHLAEGRSRRLRLSADVASRAGEVTLRYGLSLEEQRQGYRARSLGASPGRWEAVGRQGEAREAGAYLDGTVRVAPRLTLRAGLRADHFSLTDELLLAPRASATLLLTERAALSLAAGRYHQYLRPPEPVVFAAAGEAPRPVAALALARATHLSLGLEQDLGEGVGFGLEGFFKSFQGVPGGVASDANASGMDVWVRRRGDRWDGWLGYSLSWTWAMTTATGSSRFAGRHVLSTGVGAPLGERGKLSLGFVYGAGLPYSAIPFTRSSYADSPLSANRPAYDAVRQVEAMNAGNAPLLATPSRPYVRVDLSASRTWSARWGSTSMQLTPYVRLLNTLGQRDALFYRAPEEAGEPFRPVLVLPVVPLVGLEWTF